MSAVSVDIDAGELARALDSCAELKDGLAAFSWPLVRDRIAARMAEVIGSDCIAWLAQGFTTLSDLRAYKDPAAHPPGQPRFAKLLERSVSGAMRPTVTVSCAGMPPITFAFEAVMAAKFNAVTLSIEGGRITGLGGGECALTLEIKLNGRDLCGKLPLKTIKLPGKLDFDPPLEIP